MNKIILIGNLTREPENGTSASGVEYTRFTVAVNKVNANGEKTADFFNCTAFRSLGENVMRFCHKGNKVAVVGSLTIDEYTDSDNARRQRISIVCQDVEFLTPKTVKTDSSEAYEKNPTRQAKLEDIDDSDIPF